MREKTSAFLCFCLVLIWSSLMYRLLFIRRFACRSKKEYFLFFSSMQNFKFLYFYWVLPHVNWSMGIKGFVLLFNSYRALFLSFMLASLWNNVGLTLEITSTSIMIKHGRDPSLLEHAVLGLRDRHFTKTVLHLICLSSTREFCLRYHENIQKI